MQTPLPGLTFDPFQDPLFECISRDPVVTETLYNMTGYAKGTKHPFGDPQCRPKCVQASWSHW